MMRIDLVPGSAENLAEHARIPIAFKVATVLDVQDDPGAGSGVVLVERLDTRIRGWRPGHLSAAVRLALAAVLVVPLIAPTLDIVRARSGDDDPRLRAIDWIHATA